MKLPHFIARALVGAALGFPAAAAAQQERPAEEPVRVRVADDRDGVGTLAAAVLVALHQSGARPQKGIFILRADSGNANPGASFAGSDLPESAFGAARPAVSAFLRARTETGPFHLSFRLNEETLAVVGQRWEGAPDRLPELRNRAHLRAAMHRLAGIVTDDSPLYTRQTELTYLVSPSGNVVAASVTKSSGDPKVDEWLMNLLYTLTWEPGATADGMPVPVWFVQRFGLSTRRVP